MNNNDRPTRPSGSAGNVPFVPMASPPLIPAYPRMRGPAFMQQGVRVGGIMRRRSSCGARLGLFGIFCVFSSTIMLATANYDDGFLDTFNRGNDPTVTTGSMLLFVGLLLLGASGGLCYHERLSSKKYQRFGNNNPGCVHNANPGGYVAQPQPAGNPGYPQLAGYPQPTGYPQPAGYPGQPQPAGYPGQPQPAGYPHMQPQPGGYPVQPQPYGYPGQPQPYGNPGQPQPPAAYAGQPSVYPESSTSYPGPPAPYPGQPGTPAAPLNPSYPVKGGLPMDSEYRSPPPNVPGNSEFPYDPSNNPPPYRP